MPVAAGYSLATWLRNQMFDLRLLPSRKYPIPIICIGNISLGGTGKTPFTEYLVALLKKHHRVATLSRGYMRKTKGFMTVNANSTASEAGDEACQIKRKFPDVIVAVDGNRRRGIKRLLELSENERPEVILLDDGMQHRYVTPSLTVMLTEYRNMYYKDYIFPVGNLRESIWSAYRADIIVVTKCEDDIKPIDVRIIEKNMLLTANQHLYLSKIRYGRMEALFPSLALHPCSLDESGVCDEVLFIAGIANPQPLIDKFKSLSSSVQTFIFPDHHYFTSLEMEEMDVAFQKMTSEKRRIITTEKDAMRLKTNEFLPKKWKPFLYYLPITMTFLFEQGENFDSRILKHVISTVNINKKHVRN